MANKIQLKRSNIQNKVPSTTDVDLGELALNTYDGKLYTKKSDGSTETVVQLSVDSTVVKTTDSGTVTSAMIADGTIVNADVSASAAIAGTKISPDFGSQNVTTTGVVSAAAGAAATPSIAFTGDLNTGLYSPGADQVAIATGGTGRLFVDASGNIGAGTNTPATLLHVDGGTITSQRYANSGAIILRRAEGTQSSPTAISSSVGLSNLVSRGYDGSTYREAASIQVFSDGAISSTSSPGAILFGTTPSGAVNTQERLRITSAGLVGVGTSSPSPYQLYVNTTGAYSAVFQTNTDQSSNSAARRISLTAQNFRPTIQGELLSSGWVATDLLLNPSGGNVGIGTTSPADPLHVVGRIRGVATNFALQARDTGSSQTSIGLTVEGLAADKKSWELLNDASGNFQIRAINDAYTSSQPALFVGRGASAASVDYIYLATAGTERARIDSSGRLLVGTSSAYAVEGFARHHYFNPTSGENNDHVVIGASGADGFPGIFFTRTRAASASAASTAVQNGDRLGRISFFGANGSDFSNSAALIECLVDGEPFTSGDTTDLPGRLVFSTTADGASSPTERMRINSAGYLKASNNSTYVGASDSYHELNTNASNKAISVLYANNTSYAENGVAIGVSRSANSAYNFLTADSGAFATSDREFTLRGDGQAYADQSWNGGGADYAEYFEWADSNPDAEDRRGISVVLDGNKIREAQAGEDPIGVISGNPSVVGDAAWNKWSGKYLRDEFGTYIQEDYEVTDDDGNTVIQQRRKLNPAYDPDVEYVSREQRPEWDCVGLMGKLRIRKGQVTGSRWIKMRDISDSVEEWLVR